MSATKAGRLGDRAMSDELQEMFDDAEAEGDGIAEAIRYAGELIADAVSELAEAIGKAGEL